MARTSAVHDELALSHAHRAIVRVLSALQVGNLSCLRVCVGLALRIAIAPHALLLCGQTQVGLARELRAQSHI
jgi:hypothetical protein